LRAVVVALTAGCLAVGLQPAQAAGNHRISGTVTLQGGGSLPEVYIDLYRDNGSGNFLFYTPVDEQPDPDFSIVVPDGRYKIKVSTEYPELFQNEWYDDQPTKTAASVVTLDGADVVLSDIVVEDLPTITGRVIDDQGEPAEGVWIFPMTAGTLSTGELTFSEADGSFEAPVSPGDWTLFFQDDEGRYAEEWLGDANSGESADTVSVADGHVDVGTVVVSPGGSISGTVTGPDGLPMRDYLVTAAAGSSESARDWTDRDGHYLLPMLTPGDYAVRFEDDADNFVTEFYDGAADQASADPVAVTDKDVTAGIDATVVAIPHPVPAGVDISGRVTDAAGRPVPGAHVSAFAGDIQDTWNHASYDDVRTDATGHYYLTRLDGRDVSTFKIQAGSAPNEWDDDDYLLAAQWFAGATGASATPDAVPVAVVPGAPATADISLPDAGLLHGSTFTTGGTGQPGDPDGGIDAYDQHGHLVDGAWIYSDSWRVFGGMAPGTYRLDAFGIGCPGGDQQIDVVVQSLQDTNVPGAAFCRPRATVAPSILGRPVLGAVVTVDPGQWSPDSVPVGYEWLVDGVAVGTGPTYRVRPEDGGHLLAVRETRQTGFACCSPLTGVATSAVVPVPSQVPPPPSQGSEPRASLVTVTAQVRRHAPRVTLRVAVTALDAPVAGVVTVREGSRSLRTGTLMDGVLLLRLRGAKPGRHIYTVEYLGTDGVLPGTATVRVRVRRGHSAS